MFIDDLNCAGNFQSAQPVIEFQPISADWTVLPKL